MKLIGYYGEHNSKVFETTEPGFAGYLKAEDRHLKEGEFRAMTPEQVERYAEDRLLFELGQGPNPDAVLQEPEDVTEYNNHRYCAHCNAGVLAEGYSIGWGTLHFCTEECFKTAEPELWAEFEEQEQMLEDDPDFKDDSSYDPDWGYWTTWGPED